MKPKTTKIIYWTFTILFSIFLLYSGIAGLFPNEAGKAVFIALGYPLYLSIILGVAKVLGVIALLQTKFMTIKEWAYAGFTFDLLGASASFLLNGDGILYAISPLPMLVLMVVSYIFWKKTRALTVA